MSAVWDALWATPAARGALILSLSLLLAALVERGTVRLCAALNARTDLRLPEAVLASVRRPAFLTVLALGAGWASREAELPAPLALFTRALLTSLAIIAWGAAAIRLSHAGLDGLSQRARPGSLLQPSTAPLFDIAAKVATIALGLYLVFLAWDINLTAWLASAGVLGIAVGFAAKDTLANLFAGLFILADRPYQIGDWIRLDTLRGKVTHIGIRSTRLLTVDALEITVPNAMLAEGRIINESGGAERAQRLRVPVGIAYGSDLDAARAALLEAAAACAPLLSPKPPLTRFLAFGDSALELHLVVWLDDPAALEATLDALHTAIYRSLTRAGVTIPFPQRDVWLRGLPAGDALNLRTTSPQPPPPETR